MSIITLYKVPIKVKYLKNDLYFCSSIIDDDLILIEANKEEFPHNPKIGEIFHLHNYYEDGKGGQRSHIIAIEEVKKFNNGML